MTAVADAAVILLKLVLLVLVYRGSRWALVIALGWIFFQVTLHTWVLRGTVCARAVRIPAAGDSTAGPQP